MIRLGRFFRGPDRPRPKPLARGFGHALPIAPLEPSLVLSASTAYTTSSVGQPVFESTGQAYLVAPSPYLITAYATTQEPNAFQGTLPSLTFQGNFGGAAKMSLPSLSLLATGVGTIIGRANLTLPVLTLNATGTVSAVGRAKLATTSKFAVRAFSGAVASITLQDGYTVTGTARTESLGRVSITLPLFELVASGSTDSFGRADITLPSIRSLSSAVARLVGPRLQMVAVGTAVVTAEYEAYAVNLLAPTNPVPGEPPINQVSHYTNFPFTQILRFNDSYYGIGEDGIYALGGSTDDGVAIPWAFETGKTDFGSKQLKRVCSVYIGGRLADEVTVGVIVGESAPTSLTYTYTAVRDATAQTNRVKTGKGLRSRYYAFGLSDTAGSFAEVDTLDMEVENLERAT